MVPNRWKQTTLDKVLTIGGGKDYKHLEEGSIPVYGSGGYMLSVSDYLYDGESVCIGRKGTIDKPIFLKGKFWTVDTLFYTHSFKDSEPYYIYQFFQTVPWRRLNEASGVPSLSKSIINKIKINLPPLPEQRKIAKILSTWDKAISTTERLIDNSKQQKKALMQQLLTGKKRLLDESGKPFEGEWEEVMLGEIARIYQPKTISQSKLTSTGYPVYGANGIIGKYSDFNHDTEQVAVTCRGSTCGVVNWTLPKSWITGNAMVVNLDANKRCIKKFIYYLLAGSNLKYLITGSGQPQITGEIKNHKIFLPNKDEQEKLAAVLTNADKEIELLEQQLADLKQEKKALMQQLLTGKRRVAV